MKNIVIIGRYKNPSIEIIKDVLDFLSQYNLNLYIDENTKKNTNLNYPIANNKSKYDLLIVIGGDGTIINSIKNFSIESPLVGINLGRVGFLSDIKINDYKEELKKIIIDKQYTVEKREIIDFKIYNDKKIIYKNIAINDVILGCSYKRKLINFNIDVNDTNYHNYFADGIIISTPTGSTAYALSSGGSIIHPDNKVFNIVPVCSQNISNRPLIINSKNNIKITSSHYEDLYFNIDGVDGPLVKSNSEFKFKKYKKPILLIHPLNYNYFDDIKKKLN